MVAIVRSTPLDDPLKVRAAMSGGVTWVIVGSLAVFCGFVALIGLLEIVKSGPIRFQELAEVGVGAILNWVISLIFVVPVLLVLWPIVKRALRQGWAGLGVALVFGMTAACICFVVTTFIDFPLSVHELLVPAGLGMIYATLYWIGCYRAVPEAFA